MPAEPTAHDPVGTPAPPHLDGQGQAVGSVAAASNAVVTASGRAAGPADQRPRPALAEQGPTLRADGAVGPGSDLLVVGVRKDADGPAVVSRAVDPEIRARIETAARAIGATGKPEEVLRMPGEPFGLPPLMLTGLGSGEPDLEIIRLAAGAALRLASAADVVVAVTDRTDGDGYEAEATGAMLGAYRFRVGAPQGTNPSVVTVLTPGTSDEHGASSSPSAPSSDPSAGQDPTTWLGRATVIAEAVNLARRLVDTPPGDLPPAALAAHAQTIADDRITVEILDEVALAEQGFGGILAVGQGSAHPPRLVRLALAPAEAPRHLVLIGKGITFDSGGLSLKQAAGMAAMKSDMAGAAAVLATVQAVARLRLPLRVTAYLALAENMPSGTAQRPGDVITSFGGTTVEVLNTDAEGRLVLMDALDRCAADSPDAIIDIATLTGAQVVALGTRIAGVMGDDDWRDEVVASAGAAGELAWPMPIPDDLRASLDSPVADLANIGERNGGMMTAAAFLREFVPPGVPWAHIDIAGPAFVTGTPWGYSAKGGTGYGVRTLVAVAERMANGSLDSALDAGNR